MDIKSACLKKYFLILISVLFVFAYRLKIQIGIDFFNSISMGSYFPFRYLRNDVIASPKPGFT